ncbi:MAG: sulfatase-like hydrolase/transferase [Armatimonadetes bacterium]|nr:sulfatase-like hydrolase/transferase [Armatimonadota bacterium]
MPAHPNLLLCIMDDQRADTIHALGNARIATPTLDRLAAAGCFLRPYTTVPVCTPARGEVLTGRNAFRNGCRWFGEPLLADITLLPQHLAAAGYHTCHIGKWHNDGHPRDRGYHETHRVFHNDQVGGHTGHSMTFREDGGLVTGHSTELFCDRAVEFMQRAPTDRPWLCYLALHSPHDPRTAPEPWASLYRDDPPPLPASYLPEHPFDNGDMMIRDERLAGFPRGQDEIRGHLADYYAMITHHDHHLGRVLDVLERRGIRDDTLVVFTSDHGLAVGSHGLMGKENLYEHSARVPLILSGPGVPAGKRLDDCLCGHYDLMPTLCELLGLDPPATCEGVGYANVLRGEQPTVRQTVCAGYRDTMRMARDGRFKLLWYPHLDRTQLFDLAADPEETNDLCTSWRRWPETRTCPPVWTAAGGRPVPDPEDGSQPWVPHLNPRYEPAVASEEVDAVVARLRGVLAEGQGEMGDGVG